MSILSKKWIAVTMLALAVGTGLVFFLLHARVERTSGVLSQGAYVWQRRWSPEVVDAIAHAPANIHSLAVLAAEVAWVGGKPEVVPMRIDMKSLRATGKTLGLCLRIGPYPGPFNRDDATIRMLGQLAASIVDEARQTGFTPQELQLDFDCAASKLAGYTRWVQTLKKNIHPVPLVITALPSWLHRKDFVALARSCHGYVLQVHSLERPRDVQSALSLCDCASACRWVEAAARLRLPFRVALPTYGYLVAFDDQGKFLGLCAEAPSPFDVTGTRWRTVSADARALAELVQTWQKDRPALLQGLIWYRLPVAGDRLNWKPATFASVVAGKSPRSDVQVECKYPEPALAEIFLRNQGDADFAMTHGHITIEWSGGQLLAVDALHGFTVERNEASQLRLFFPQTEPCPSLRPEESWQIAWLRFDQRTEVRTVCTTTLK